ncbi:MAG: bifunctional DNA-formamidopyrimidine glycosylase/DNA-(apurinic or apyrimidinic site) lyase [Pirellulaceae bacterium]|nr:bifunctional DNA-formamidopyrimidine glycosylase/DNA-(apurinic or apyrimidinic site) lyase [Pirellulaceae bacterium]
MPELPEVETMCRGLRPIVGCCVASVTAPPCPCRPISMQPSVAQIHRRLRGQAVTGVRRLGKRVLIDFRYWTLILQPKMTGLVALDEVPDSGHTRLVLRFSGRRKLELKFWDRRGLGTVELLPPEEVEQRIVAGRLGPDALEITASQFRQRMTGTRRPIKIALLDQKLLAGVGNLYASEMLHAARIHPALPANQLSRQQAQRLHRSMIDILRQAIKYEGSTLADGTYRNTLNDPGGYQNHHRVYDRAGQLCLSCRKSHIVRIVQAQRSTYYCPHCQPICAKKSSTASKY